ncbi:Cenp-O kinetochore centromere component-domain-containing protein [Pyronema omphalodes]|nr:Cenp-O kinetochore centromere component-domain-containing protein [Pyronema omphalodes]
MSSLLEEVTSRNTELLTLRSRLASLRAQHPVSSSTPTDSPLIPTPADTLDSRILNYTLHSASSFNLAVTTNLYRLSGVTTFTCRELSGQTLLGIRFETFAGDGRFGKPVYVMLEQRRNKHTKNGEATWGVARHSAPAWINIGELERKWLPVGEKVQAKQDVRAFVREVRRRVELWGRRKRAVEGLVKVVGRVRERMETGDGRGRVKEVETDREVGLLTVRWEDGREAKARVDERGRVARVVVVDKNAKRDGDLERRMRGTLEGLAERLGWS